MMNLLLLFASCLFSMNTNVEANTQCSEAPTDVIFLVDDSGSLKDADFQKELLFVNHLISFFDLSPSGYQVGVTTFSTDVHTYLKLGSTSNKNQIYSTVGKIFPTRGMTFLGKALQHIIREGFSASGGSRNGARKVLIIVTDGDTIDLQDTIVASMLLKGLKVNIFVIGIGTRLNQANLQRIVSRPEDLFQTKTFDELPKIAQSLKAVVCKKPTNPVISCSEAPTDVIFLVDDSGSLKDADFQKELLFVNNLISFFDLSPSSYQVGVTTFSTDVHTYLKLGSTSNKNQIYSTVGKISPTRGMTFLGKALQHIIREGFSASGGSRNGARKVLIIVTDGDTIDLQDTITASMLLKGLKVNIFVIGIGTRLNQANLQRIVSRPEDLFQTKTFDELPKIAQSLKAVVCKKPTIPTCTKCSMPPTDLVFLVDDSDSLKPTDFQKELFFVNHLISFFDLSPDHYQVGVSTFSTDVHTYLEIGSSNDKNQIKSVISGIKPSRGMTFLGKALGNTVNKAFSAGGKSRRGVRKVLVVITDGDTVDIDWTLKMAQNLKLLKIELFAIGVGSHLNMDYLKKIVTIPQNLFQVQNFNSLNIVSNSVRKAVCKETTDCTVFE